jgi:Fe2+ or Zn2+ uptake regulation protein
MSVQPGPEMTDPTPEEVLQFVQEKERPFVKTKEVAENFEQIERRTVFNRLEKLVERGDLVKHKVTENVAVWYTPDQLSSPNRRSPSSDSQ